MRRFEVSMHDESSQPETPSANAPPTGTRMEKDTNLAFASDDSLPTAGAPLPPPGERGMGEGARDKQEIHSTRVVDNASSGAARTARNESSASSIFPTLGPNGLDLDDFRLLQKIGEGAMGAVY